MYFQPRTQALGEEKSLGTRLMYSLLSRDVTSVLSVQMVVKGT